MAANIGGQAVPASGPQQWARIVWRGSQPGVVTHCKQPAAKPLAAQTCNSTRSLSARWSRPTDCPSKMPLPQMRADFNLSAKSRWTKPANLRLCCPRGR